MTNQSAEILKKLIAKIKTDYDDLDAYLERAEGDDFTRTIAKMEVLKSQIDFLYDEFKARKIPMKGESDEPKNV